MVVIYFIIEVKKMRKETCYLMLEVVDSETAQTAGPALASMLVYILMAVILFFKPQGLFPARTG